MAEVLVQFSDPVLDEHGVAYTAQAVGRVGDNDLWEGWLEFIPVRHEGEPMRTARETTQPNRTDLAYWATGLSMIYLEGALRRAKAPTRTVRRPTVDAVPYFSEPALETLVVEGALPSPRAVLDPFAVYAQGEDVLRRELTALHDGHLRSILRAYAPTWAEMPAASEAELRERIIAVVRGARLGIRDPAFDRPLDPPGPNSEAR